MTRLSTEAGFLADMAKPRAVPMQRETFDTVQIASGAITGQGATVHLGRHETLDAAIADGCRTHKSVFFVRQTDTLTDRVMLKFYAVKKKSRPEYRYHDYETRAVRDLYAEHLFDVREDALRGGEGLSC